MLIACPYCGLRDVSEFTYQGDGNRTRPNPMSQDMSAWNDYIYERVNISGDQNEIWQHSGGCRSHLRVTRNTLTHKISSVAFARPELAPSSLSKPSQAKPTAKKSSPAQKAAPTEMTVAKRSKS
jgi:heterotetrameric sarcosine oxidase delta subunit